MPVCRPASSMISSTPVRRLRNTIWTMSVRERSSRRPRRLMGASGGRAGERDTGCRVPGTWYLGSPFSRLSLWTDCRSRAEIVAFQNAVEDAVDELRRLIRAEFLGDLDGLIDDDELRRIVLVEELVNGHTHDVAVDDGHARETPVLRLRLNHVVERFQVLDGSLKDLRRELARVRLDRKSTRLNSSHTVISYAVFCLKKK